MLVEHLGEVMDVDPRVASFEQKLIRALRTYGPTRNRDLWFRSGAQRVGRDIFAQALENLTQRHVIVRETTSRVNTFIYRMAPDPRGRKPLTPEAA